MGITISIPTSIVLWFLDLRGLTLFEVERLDPPDEQVMIHSDANDSCISGNIVGGMEFGQLEINKFIRSN